MPPTITKLFSDHGPHDAETITPLLEGQRFRLEHIASYGQPSPADFWYDQDTLEWVALIQGQAVLVFEDGPVSLAAGDAVLIPPHCKHRVSEVSMDAVWIALHADSSGE
ncbi:MAG: AraC family ligand binding domain-containing protein [Phycisphaeraceae bacterium]|nr:AraC family ligand binding domain-containing protein [Phycisphaeraceae bacterium]